MQSDLFPQTIPSHSQPTSKTTTAADRLETYGARALDDADILTLIGVPEAAARALMAQVNNSLADLAKLTAREIETVPGISANKARAIAATFEIGRRRQYNAARQREQITTSQDAADILLPLMADETQEVFTVIFLNRRSHIIKVEEIHRGGVAAMVVDPKVIFQKAMIYKASSIILSHNHPSGSPSPSIEDIRLTEKIKVGANFLDMRVLDHIIIGENIYYSFADEGKI